jgi:pyruvate formate lyase activating enzyme
LRSGLVFDIKRFSIHDGPGIRTTVFLKGCPMDCWWCHNPESQKPGPELMVRENRCIRCGACMAACEHGAVSLGKEGSSTDRTKCVLCGACTEVCYAEARELVGQEMTVAKVMSEIERDVAFYDQSGGGATISGGEPLMQPGFLRALLLACQREEIHTALDTCGFASWETLDRIRPYVDLFLYDLKLIGNDRHHRFTGVSNEAVLSNLRALSQEGHDVIVRVPVIPGVNDDKENMRHIAGFLADLPRQYSTQLLPYHSTAAAKYERLDRDNRMGDTHPPSDGTMAALAQVLEEFGLHTEIGG